ncbi:MAG: DinB family protein [Dehalococcoidia bacterium]
MAEPATYQEELLERIRRTTGDLVWAVESLDFDAATLCPSDTEWSIHEHLSHLVDMEQEVYLPLLRWATVPEMLDPRDYSRKDWHERRYRPNESVDTLLGELARFREEELAIFHGLRPSAWTAWREDTRWGPLTCQWIAEVVYRHALDHLQGIMALRSDLTLEALRPAPRAFGRDR